MDIEYGGLIGLYGGLLFGVMGWYLGRRKAKKAGGNDEVQSHIFRTARSFSWFATIGTVYILFTLYGIGIEMGIAATLGTLMLVQLSSWGLSAVLLSYYYSVEKALNVYLVSGLMLIIIPAVLFLVIAILTRTWIFLFCPIPIGIVGWYFIKLGNTEEEGGH